MSRGSSRAELGRAELVRVGSAHADRWRGGPPVPRKIYPDLVTVTPAEPDHPANGGRPDSLTALQFEAPSGLIPDSPRVAAAEQRALARRMQQGLRLRLLLWPLLVIVLVPGFVGHPRPGLSGRGLVVTLCLVVFAAVTIVVSTTQRPNKDLPASFLLLPLIMGACGIGLLATQNSIAGQVPATLAVALAFLRLPLSEALGVGGVITAGVALTTVAVDGGADDAAATILLCVTLGLMALMVRRSWDAEAGTEKLMAQLLDAREEHTKAAALAERGRIARDLHDVLAQSLSGLAIQLEAARRIARRDGVDGQLGELLDRASALTRDGLSDARRAVAALRGDAQASLDMLPSLVERYREDLRLDASLSVTGTARPLPQAAGEALLRGAQEALTNAARYARGSAVRVELDYQESTTVLSVQDIPGPGSAVPAEAITGSGLGLRGMAERLAQAGGQVQAGPAGDGWLVRMEVPA